LNDTTVSSPIVFNVPPQNNKVLQEQQGTPIDTYTQLKQFIFQGGLNTTVGTTRYKYNYGVLHITKVWACIKSQPTNDCITELNYYNGVSTTLLMRFFHQKEVHDIAGDVEDYKYIEWDFVPPLIFKADYPGKDYLSISTDGSSDGEFTIIGYDQVQ